jgi:hypothetical protein
MLATYAPACMNNACELWYLVPDIYTVGLSKLLDVGGGGGGGGG